MEVVDRFGESIRGSHSWSLETLKASPKRCAVPAIDFLSLFYDVWFYRSLYSPRA